MGLRAALRTWRSRAVELTERGYTILFGSPSWAGIAVNEDMALKLSAYVAAVRCIAEGIGGLPLVLYERGAGESRVRARSFPEYTLWHDVWNPTMTAMQGIETTGVSLATRGNGFIELVLNDLGRPIELWPVRPMLVTKRMGENYEPFYEIATGKGKPRVVPAARMIHIRAMSRDGWMGLDPLSYMAEVIADCTGVHQSAATFFKNGFQSQGFLRHPKRMPAKVYKAFRKRWKIEHENIEKRHGIIILEDGMEFQPITMTPEAARLLESKQFGVTEMARAFGLPPHRLGALERATFSNIEHMSLEFAIYSLRPWLRRIEAEINGKLYAGTPYYVEFLMDDILRGDSKARNEALEIEMRNTVLTPNEWRAMLNRSSVEGGDDPLVPVNMTTLKRLLAQGGEKGDTGSTEGKEEPGT